MNSFLYNSSIVDLLWFISKFNIIASFVFEIVIIRPLTIVVMDLMAVHQSYNFIFIQEPIGKVIGHTMDHGNGGSN